MSKKVNNKFFDCFTGISGTKFNPGYIHPNVSETVYPTAKITKVYARKRSFGHPVGLMIHSLNSVEFNWSMDPQDFGSIIHFGYFSDWICRFRDGWMHKARIEFCSRNSCKSVKYLVISWIIILVLDTNHDDRIKNDPNT